MLSRKIISASISSVLYSVLLALFNPNPLGEDVVEHQNYFYSFITVLPMYLLYSVPVILTYGVATSFVSDKIAERLTRDSNKRNQLIISTILHVLFGLIYLPYVLGASILFFVMDKSLQKWKSEFDSSQALISLLLPVLVWFLLLGIIWMEHFIKNGF